jgi:hypothetical protein
MVTANTKQSRRVSVGALGGADRTGVSRRTHESSSFCLIIGIGYLCIRTQHSAQKDGMVPRESRARPRARTVEGRRHWLTHVLTLHSFVLALYTSPRALPPDTIVIRASRCCVSTMHGLPCWRTSTLGPARGIRACVGTGGKKGLVLHLYCHLPYHVTVTPRKEIRTAGQGLV